jgi:spore maturation protein CgeB
MLRKKVLFVSSSSADKLNVMYEAFKTHGMFDISVIYRGKIGSTYYNDTRSIVVKFLEKLGFPLDWCNQNNQVVEYCKNNNPDFIFIVKGNQIKPSTLRKIKNNNIQVKIISWSQDDMYAKHNRSYYYKWGLKYYDLVVTQKSYNCNPDELPKLGAKEILFQNKAYLPEIHKPCIDCSPIKTRHDVLFIGSAEIERFESMLFLAKNGIQVDVYGSGWNKECYRSKAHKNLIFHYENLINDDYSNAISCSKISLCFLRKMNRDLQTSRSVEIPACGGFMLAERTFEQKKMFIEGEEADFFSNNEELLKKVNIYLGSSNRRRIISNNGRNRCLKSGYSYQDRVNEIMGTIG